MFRIDLHFTANFAVQHRSGPMHSIKYTLFYLIHLAVDVRVKENEKKEANM